MFESIIFHFIFVLFVIIAFVWWLATKKKYLQLKDVLIPTLLRNKIEFPQDRSLVVRSVTYLQEELSEYFQCKVKIEVKFLKSSYNFLTPLCYLLWKSELEQNKYFRLKGDDYSSKELISYVMLQVNKKNITLNYNFDKNIWNVEILYA